MFLLKIFLFLVALCVVNSDDLKSDGETVIPEITIRPEIASHTNLHLLPRFPKCGFTPPTSNHSRRKRVTGGLRATSNQFNWMVQIYTKSVLSNTTDLAGAGTLINSRYVLTSAAVMPILKKGAINPSIIYYVHVGMVGGPTPENVNNKHYIEKVVTHDEVLLTSNRKHNIALLRLSTPVIFDDVNNYNPICLPIENLERDMSKPDLKIAGWGTVLPGSTSTPENAFWVSMRLVPNEFCDRVYVSLQGRLDKHQLCGISKSIYKDAGICNDDYGDPLMLSEKRKTSDGSLRQVSTQLGIVSYASHCGKQGFPTIFLNVTEYLPWILDNIEE